jgi:hypothetical protein
MAQTKATAGNTLFWSYIGQFIVLFSINKVEQEIDGSGSLHLLVITITS